jgi:rhodanese-related sulfurtransferase
MNRLKVWLAGLLLLPAVAVAAHLPPVVGDLITSARASVKVIDMEGFKRVIDDPAGALIIDVREESEYASGHIPGAVHLPRGVVEFGIWQLVGFPAEVDFERPIYVQCVSGNRASLAAKTLKELGFTDVTAVVMHLAEWQKAGYPFRR